MKKKLFTVVFAGIMALGSLSTAFAGQWVQDSVGWWYQNDDGTWPASVLKQIDSKWYYFDSTGYMKTGNFEFQDGWYHFREDGSCSNPLSPIDGTPAGAPAEGWVYYGTSTTEAVQGILDGDIIWHNDMCWISQNHFNDLSDLAMRDIVVRKSTNTLTPDSYIDFSSASYYGDTWDEDDDFDDYDDFDDWAEDDSEDFDDWAEDDSDD